MSTTIKGEKYTINQTLEVKLLSTVTVLYHVPFYIVALRHIQSCASVHLMASAVEILNTSDGSGFTTFAQVSGPHPALSLQHRSAPANRPSHKPARFLLTCLPPPNLLRIRIQLAARFVVKLPIKAIM